MQVSEFIRRVEREGWRVRLRNGGHLELSHPLADRAIITSATPGDGRWWRNTMAEMKRALPAEPKRVRLAEPRPKRKPTPRPMPKPRPGIEIAAGEISPEELLRRRLPGGPEGYGNAWSRLF